VCGFRAIFFAYAVSGSVLLGRQRWESRE